MDQSEFLRLLTGLAKIVKPMHRNAVEIASMDAPFKELDIDSLDTLMLVIYTCELHGIPEEVGKQCYPRNAQDLWQFVEQHKTQDVDDVEAALEACK